MHGNQCHKNECWNIRRSSFRMDKILSYVKCMWFTGNFSLTLSIYLHRELALGDDDTQWYFMKGLIFGIVIPAEGVSIFENSIWVPTVANVHHSHVISIIRRTHIQWTKRSVQVRKIAHMPHLHYIAKYHKCSNPALLSRFICMFNLFMSFRHLRDYSRKSCCCFFFENMGHTPMVGDHYCPASQVWQWRHVLFTKLSGT